MYLPYMMTPYPPYRFEAFKPPPHDIQIQRINKMNQFLVSACAIELEEKVIFTGGAGNSRAVKVYNNEGMIKNETLPSFKQGRKDHGCGYFINSDNIMVLIVAGGYWQHQDEDDTLVSTEKLVIGEESWKAVGNLPTAMSSMRGISYNNKIIMIGGKYQLTYNRFTCYNSVISYDTTSDQWTHVGNTTQKRCDHGASIVSSIVM